MIGCFPSTIAGPGPPGKNPHHRSAAGSTNRFSLFVFPIMLYGYEQLSVLVLGQGAPRMRPDRYLLRYQMGYKASLLKIVHSPFAIWYMAFNCLRCRHVPPETLVFFFADAAPAESRPERPGTGNPPYGANRRETGVGQTLRPESVS